MDHILAVIFKYEFLQKAFIAGTLASVICGLTGPFVVTKRMSYVAGGLAHAVFGGVGIAVWMGWNPFIGALIFALLAALLMSWIHLRFEQREDHLISTLWSAGMAIGLIGLYQTPGYHTDIISILFGNILMASDQDIQILSVIFLALILIMTFFYRRLVVLCFDDEYAMIRGFSRSLLYTLLLIIIALTVVILMRVVGLILLIAMLSLPSAIAGLYQKTLAGMMRMAMLLGTLFIWTGLSVSYYSNLPSGPTIILLTAAGYMMALIHTGSAFFKRPSSK